MAGVISQANVNALFTGAKMKFLEVYGKYVSDFTGVYQDIPSGLSREGYIVAASAGGMERLSEAKKHMGDSFARVLYVENGEPWAKFMEVTEQQIELQQALNWLNQQAMHLANEAAALSDDLIVAGLQGTTAWVDGTLAY